MIALLDPNVIVRFLVSVKSPQHKNPYSFFESLEYGKMKVELKLIVLFQVLFVLKSFYFVSFRIHNMFLFLTAGHRSLY
jgi:hypothetical protein